MKMQAKQLNYKVLDWIMLATFLAEGKEQGRHPGVSVVNRDVWRSNRLDCLRPSDSS